MQYVERKRLASLGLTSALGGLPGDLADAFIVIDSYLDELRTKDSERARRRKGG